MFQNSRVWTQKSLNAHNVKLKLWRNPILLNKSKLKLANSFWLSFYIWYHLYLVRPVPNTAIYSAYSHTTQKAILVQAWSQTPWFKRLSSSSNKWKILNSLGSIWSLNCRINFNVKMKDKHYCNKQNTQDYKQHFLHKSISDKIK